MATADLSDFVDEAQGWAGGVNIRDAITLLAVDEAQIMENGILDEKGGWGKRMGTQSQGTFGAGIDRGIATFTYYRGDILVPQIILQTDAGNLYYTSDPTANPIVWTLIASGLSLTAPMSFETFAGNCYMSNGVDSYAKWDGTTYTTFGTAPKGKYLRLWKDTMFMGGITGLPDRVYESAAGDAETWPVASWIDIAKGDGDQIKGLGSDGYTLIVFKQRRHMAITDPVTLTNRIVDYEKGCEGHNTIIQFESEVYFLSRLGICKYLGDSPSVFVSYKLDPMFDPRIINLSALESSRAYAISNRVGWAIPEAGKSYPTVQIEYYPRLGVISPYGIRGIGPWSFNRMPARVFTRWRWQSNEFLYGAASGANKFYYLLAPVGTDDGASFTAILETGAYTFKSPTRTKYIRRVRIIGRGRFYMQIRENYETAIIQTSLADMASSVDMWNLADAWGTGTWGPDSWIKEAEIDPDCYARAFTFRFADYEVGLGHRTLHIGGTDYGIDTGEWGVYGVVVEGKILGLRE